MFLFKYTLFSHISEDTSYRDFFLPILLLYALIFFQIACVTLFFCNKFFSKHLVNLDCPSY